LVRILQIAVGKRLDEILAPKHRDRWGFMQQTLHCQISPAAFQPFIPLPEHCFTNGLKSSNSSVWRINMLLSVIQSCNCFGELFKILKVCCGYTDYSESMATITLMQ
jgi:hypothetical protein